MPAALNAANEVAVARFLREEIAFLDIPRINEAVMNQHVPVKAPTLEDILDVDEWARTVAKSL